MPIEIASEKALGDRASVQSQARKRPGRRKDVIAKRIGLKVVTYIGLTTVALIVIIPFILMLTTSLKTVAESSTYPPSLLPAVPQCPRPRTAGRSSARGVRRAMRRTGGTSGAAARSGWQPDRHARVPPARAVAQAAGNPAGPDRVLRGPRLAQRRQPWPRAPLDARKRHRTGRRQP